MSRCGFAFPGFQATRTFAFLEWNWRSSSVQKEHTAPPFVKGSALVHHRDMQARPSRWSPHKESILFEPALEIEHNCPLQTHHGVNHLGLDCRPGLPVQLTEAWAGNRLPTTPVSGNPGQRPTDAEVLPQACREPDDADHARGPPATEGMPQVDLEAVRQSRPLLDRKSVV